MSKDTLITLELLPESFAVCRLPPNEAIPKWAAGEPFFSVSKTGNALSIVCAEANVPAGIKCDRDWRCLEVQNPPFESRSIGCTESIAKLLGASGVIYHPVSTFEAEFLLVKGVHLNKAVLILKAAGHKVNQ